jgi:sugar/nucleoside kinase (ribokinase family)
MQKKGESQRTWVVVGFGENSVDLIAATGALPGPDGKAELDGLTTLPGGQISTASIGCARLGLRTCYVGAWGTDANGALVHDALTGAGVDTTLSRTIDGQTRTAIILVESARQSRIVLWRRDPALNWPAERLPVSAVDDAHVLLVDATDIDGAIRMATAARAAGVLTVADVDGQVPGLDRLLRLTDILVVSATFTSDLRQLHRDSGARVVIATLGADGAVAWDGTVEHYSPGFVVPVVDTTGAGDAFRAGLIAALLQSEPWTLDPPSPRLRRASPGEPWTLDPVEPWTTVLDFANACAALNCRGRGAQAGLPTRAEVQGFVTSPTATRSKRVWGAGHVSRLTESTDEHTRGYTE